MRLMGVEIVNQLLKTMARLHENLKKSILFFFFTFSKVRYILVQRIVHTSTSFECMSSDYMRILLQNFA